MNFALAIPDSDFQLSPYLEQICDELTVYGYKFEISDRLKADTTVRKAFVKDDSLGKLIALAYRPRTGPMQKLRIKLEVDTNPPSGATYNMPFLDYPFPAAVRVFDLPSLFAGKLHALLCRSYLKGRDWYDFIGYTARRTSINHELLSCALRQQGPWKGQSLHSDNAWCTAQLSAMITKIDWLQAQRDVERFIKTHELPSLKIWSREYFLQQCNKLNESQN
jgi:hypothetical protein